MLKLLCGPSGSGKTATLIDLIRRDIETETRCFLLVPEQQAYISERDLPAFLPKNAGLFFEVVNFSSLAEDIFRICGGVTQGSINPALRTLLMWDTLRTSAPLLKQYGTGASTDSTLTTLMLQAVEELHASGITPDALEEAAKKLPEESPLRKKLFDLAMIDSIFHEKCESCFGSDPADKLLRAAQMLETEVCFANCNLYVDSFTSFTSQEYRLLQELVKQANSLTVALTCDSLRSTLPHFESTMETAKRFQKMARKHKQDLTVELLSPREGSKPRALEILQRDLWRFDISANAREELSKEEQAAVRTVVAGNLYEESEAAALHILELVLSGMHFGEIAVVVRDIDAYRGVLDAAFERYGIPYFLSERTDLSAKPLSRLILSALRAVSRGYHVQDIITLIKTGLAGISEKDAALFEEYCETWHINGARFTEPVWSMNPDGLTTERSPRAEEILLAANRVRKAIMEPLQRLAASMKEASSFTDRCRALYAYLIDIDLSQTLSERAKKELASGQRREAGETVRLYQFLNETLAELSEQLQSTQLTLDEYVYALTLLFSQTNLGSVPNLHDCVIIGSADTLRVENVKASLLLGLCEGEFPRAISDTSILTEADKLQLEGLEIYFDTREKTRATEELLYVYRAITKPTERLILSTAAFQTDGSAKTPSLAFSRVLYLLNRKDPEAFDAEAVRRACGDACEKETSDVILQLPPSEDGVLLRLSQSKMQCFLRCPYSYYSTYQLKLRQKMDSRPSYADDGTFLHYVFEHFLRASLDENGRLSPPPPEEIEPIADRIIHSYISEICPFPQEAIDRRMLHSFMRLRRLGILMLHDILGELQSGGFVPSKFEQVIGMPGENGLPPVVLELKNGSRVSLSGKIDRIDLFESEDKLYVRVVDYKTGVHKFSTEDVRSGMDIQLVLYLFAVLSADPGRYEAAGAQYLYASVEKGKPTVSRSGFLLDDPCVQNAVDESCTYQKKLTLQTEEEIRTLCADMCSAVQNAAERILAGDAQKTPSEEACRFCPVRDHCDKAYHQA